MTRPFSTIGVVGLGTMGAGIVEVFARAGHTVIGVEPTQEGVTRGRGHLQTSIDRAVRRGKLEPEVQREMLGRITLAASLDALAPADLVVEAVPESMTLKRDVFATLDRICRPDAVLATNTSSLSVTDIAVTSSLPGRVVGMHFFNPAPVLRLVEVVRTVLSEPDVVDDVAALAGRLGKAPVVVGDQAGFVANALLFGYLNAAVSTYASGYATRDDIDSAMRLACGLPMGPLALLDLIGLDTAHEILQTMYAQSRDRLHAPVPLLGQLATAGRLGRKSGQGFYAYEAPGSPVVEQGSAPVPPAGSARPVRVAAVAGSGAGAARLAAVLATAGVTVRRLSDDDLPGLGVDALRDCQLVVEAGTDDRAARRAAVAALDAACAPGTVLVTTASTVPVVACAAATTRPADVVGMHVPATGSAGTVLEVVTTVSTAPDAVATVLALCEAGGAHPVVCGDRAGFLVDALLVPYLNDAARMVAAGYATVDDADTAMRLGCGYPAGPFEVLDAVGLDVALAVQRSIHRERPEPGLAPSPLLEHLVTAGHLGKATGRGFREHAAAVRTGPGGGSVSADANA